MKKLIFKVVFILFVINLPAQQVITFQPGPEGKDARAWSNHPDLNLGDIEKFIAMSWTFNGVDGVERSYIDFDLSEIPQSSTIIEARLSLFFYSDEYNYIPHTGDNGAYIQSVTSFWGEDNLTWNHMPETTSEDQIYLPQSTDPEQDYTDIDVTTLIKKQFENPDEYYGLSLRLVTESTFRSLMFASSDNTDPDIRPKLVVTYDPCWLPESNFTYSQTEDGMFTFTDLSNLSDSWYWDFGDGYYSTLTNPEHTYAEFGEYSVCLTVSDSCGSDIYCDSVKYCQKPNVDFQYTVLDRNVMFINMSQFGATYYWDFGDGYSSTLENPEHTYAENNSYQVCLSVSNICDTIELCDTLEILAGIDEKYFLNVVASPNPFTHSVFLKYSLSAPAEIEFSVYTNFGELIYQTTEQQEQGKQIIKWNAENQPASMYIYRLQAGEFTSVGKLILTGDR